MRDSAQVFIIDDSLPKLEEFIERRVYEKAIEKTDLLLLAHKGKWSGEASLRQLIVDLLTHDFVTRGRLEIVAYNHPEICLSELSGHQPDVLIYDWEYGDPFKRSSDWLLDILHKTTSFVFVYSAMRDEVPPFLNKTEFDKYANRFQLFAKGNSNNSVFSSEDFIYQYILNLLEDNNVIKIQGIDVSFEASGYLKNPTDILHLESILGRAALLEQISQNDNRISEMTVEKILESAAGKMLLSRDKGLLATTDFPLLFNQVGLAEEVSYVTVLREFGLEKLKEAIETGFAKV